MTLPSDAKDSVNIPAWAWLWLPMGLVIAVIAWRIVDEGSYRLHFENELGFAENGTALLLIPGIYAAILVWRRRAQLPFRLLGLWFGLVGLGCVYFAGEELSWGIIRLTSHPPRLAGLLIPPNAHIV